MTGVRRRAGSLESDIRNSCMYVCTYVYAKLNEEVRETEAGEECPVTLLVEYSHYRVERKIKMRILWYVARRRER